MPLGLLARPLRAMAAVLALGAVLAVAATGLHFGFHEGLHAAEDLSTGHPSAGIQVEQLPCPVCSLSRTWAPGLPTPSPDLFEPGYAPRVELPNAFAILAAPHSPHGARAPPMA